MLGAEDKGLSGCSRMVDKTFVRTISSSDDCCRCGCCRCGEGGDCAVAQTLSSRSDGVILTN